MMSMAGCHYVAGRCDCNGREPCDTRAPWAYKPPVAPEPGKEMPKVPER